MKMTDLCCFKRLFFNENDRQFQSFICKFAFHDFLKNLCRESSLADSEDALKEGVGRTFV
jgi:hypothetical protein